MKLTNSLTATSETPVVLFSASQAPWVKGFASSKTNNAINFITDGPFMHRCKTTNELIMLWSSTGHNDEYCVGIARSTSGSIAGPWTHDSDPLFSADGGHAMLAKIFYRKSNCAPTAGDQEVLVLSLHMPNKDMRNCTPKLFALLEYQDQKNGLAKFEYYDFV